MTWFRKAGEWKVLDKAVVREYLKASIVITLSGCWVRLNRKTGNPLYGYGQSRFNKKKFADSRLALWVFNDIPLEIKGVLCHRCDNPPCINPEHVYLGSYATNAQDRDNRGRRPILRGDNNPASKLSTEIVTKIRATWTNRTFDTQRELAKAFGVSQQHVSRILRGERW